MSHRCGNWVAWRFQTRGCPASCPQVPGPGPSRWCSPKTALIPDEATAGLASVAVRLPSHPLFRRLIRLAGVPLAAPSANPFGYVSPTTSEHVRTSLGSRIRHILEGGPSRIGLESTIVDLRDPLRPVLLRPGAVTLAQIARTLGVPVVRARKSRPRGRAQVAPGQMARHYSPRTPVLLHPRLTSAMVEEGAAADAWLFISRPRSAGSRNNVFWLDAKGDLRGAARRLFATLRRIDEPGIQADPCGTLLTVPALPRPWTTGSAGGRRRNQPRTEASSLRSRSFWAAVPTVTRTCSGRL